MDDRTLADVDLAIVESKLPERWPLRDPREVLTAYGQSITLEAQGVHVEEGSLEEQPPGPSGLFNLFCAPEKLRVKCVERGVLSSRLSSATLKDLPDLARLPRTVRYLT